MHALFPDIGVLGRKVDRDSPELHNRVGYALAPPDSRENDGLGLVLVHGAPDNLIRALVELHDGHFRVMYPSEADKRRVYSLAPHGLRKLTCVVCVVQTRLELVPLE